MNLTREDYEAIQPVAARIASSIRRRHTYVDREDVEQECLLWAVAHVDKVQEYLAEEGGEKRLARAMWNAGVRYVQSSKAQSAGYEPADLYFYSTRELGALLGVVFDKAAWSSPPPGDGERVSGGDPAVGGNWLATLVDVDRAFQRLDAEDQQVLQLRYLAGGTDKIVLRDLAERYGVAVSTVDRRIKRALRALQDELGGPRPEDDREWTGSRRTLSRAAAMAEIRGAYDDEG